MMESNLVILNYNPNGLWWGSEGGKHADGKKGRLDLELPFAEKKFGKIDVLCIQESHLGMKEMEGIPRTLHGFEWLHDPAQDGRGSVNLLVLASDTGTGCQGRKI